jgi:hypothetical protein
VNRGLKFYAASSKEAGGGGDAAALDEAAAVDEMGVEDELGAVDETAAGDLAGSEEPLSNSSAKAKYLDTKSVSSLVRPAVSGLGCGGGGSSLKWLDCNPVPFGQRNLYAIQVAA